MDGTQRHYDDLGGAYYFADDEESFQARTPKGGCGCLSACVFLLALFMLLH